jgi:hypothetical protein
MNIMSSMMMEGTAKAAVDVRAIIVHAVGQREYRPSELVEMLLKQNISEDRSKEALDSLIDEQRLFLTPDRRIKLRTNPPIKSR